MGRSRIVAAVGLVAVVGVIGLAFALDPSDADTASTPGPASDVPATTVATPDLPDRGPHPELIEIDGWLQSDVTSLEELEGKVVAVQFWTFGCSNCKATLPHMQELYQKYADQGFEIVGIHAPEFEYEAEVGEHRRRSRRTRCHLADRARPDEAHLPLVAGGADRPLATGLPPRS